MSQKDENGYVPNEVPLRRRLENFIFASIFIVSGGYGVWKDDLMITLGGASRGHVRGAATIYHLHGQLAMMMYIGTLLFCVALIAPIVDHYDKRNNQHIYHKIVIWTFWPGAILCTICTIIGIWQSL